MSLTDPTNSDVKGLSVGQMFSLNCIFAIFVIFLGNKKIESPLMRISVFLSCKQNSQLHCCLLGTPQIGDVTCIESPHLSCKRDKIKMRDYMDREVTPPKKVTSSGGGGTPLYKPYRYIVCSAPSGRVFAPF